MSQCNIFFVTILNACTQPPNTHQSMDDSVGGILKLCRSKDAEKPLLICRLLVLFLLSSQPLPKTVSRELLVCIGCSKCDRIKKRQAEHNLFDILCCWLCKHRLAVEKCIEARVSCIPVSALKFAISGESAPVDTIVAILRLSSSSAVLTVPLNIMDACAFMYHVVCEQAQLELPWMGTCASADARILKRAIVPSVCEGCVNLIVCAMSSRDHSVHGLDVPISELFSSHEDSDSKQLVSETQYAVAVRASEFVDTCIKVPHILSGRTFTSREHATQYAFKTAYSHASADEHRRDNVMQISLSGESSVLLGSFSHVLGETMEIAQTASRATKLFLRCVDNHPCVDASMTEKRSAAVAAIQKCCCSLSILLGAVDHAKQTCPELEGLLCTTVNINDSKIRSCSLHCALDLCRDTLTEFVFVASATIYKKASLHGSIANDALLRRGTWQRVSAFLSPFLVDVLPRLLAAVLRESDGACHQSKKVKRYETASGKQLLTMIHPDIKASVCCNVLR